MNKKLKIKIDKKEKSHLLIQIIDNGIGRDKSSELKSKKIHKPDSIGIKLTEERLNNFYKDYKYGYDLIFTDLFDKNKMPLGTQVTLKIPLK